MLRNVDVSPAEHEGQQYILLRDSSGYVEDSVILSPAAFFVAAHLDGTNDVVDIQYAFVNQFGSQGVAEEDIVRVVDYLDEQGFLQTERFEAIRQVTEQAFHGAESRPAFLAGKSYPADPDELREYLDSQFTSTEGPGRKPVPGANSGVTAKCLIVPHIDLDRGGAAYAHGYMSLAEGAAPATAYVFGVSHAMGEVPFILTRKHFDTPLGRLETDVDAVERLARACVWDPFADEIAHRVEHSIEFQVLMLAHLFGTGVRIVPVLCGRFPEDHALGEPAGMPELAPFLDACRALVAERSDTVAIAAADLAHVGRRFGDDLEIDDAVKAATEKRDREDLDLVRGLDADAFYRSVMKDGNRRNVCGHNPIYAAMKAVDGAVSRAELLSYGAALDPAGGLVTFASVALLS